MDSDRKSVLKLQEEKNTHAKQLQREADVVASSI